MSVVNFDSSKRVRFKKRIEAIGAFFLFVALWAFTIYQISLDNDLMGTIKQITTSEWWVISFWFFFVSYGLYLVSRQFFDFWRNCFTIELHEDRIIGFNSFGVKRKELKYDGIFFIDKQMKNFDHIQLRNVRKKKLLVIHSGINDLGNCMRLIEKRSKNIFGVDYGGLDKNKDIWDRADKEKW